VLGLPASLRDDDIDQDMPAEIDDGFITEWSILSQPADQPSIMMGCNVYTRLMGIISKITRYIYPLKALLVDGKGLIRLELVKEIEQDLERWRTSIPEHLIQPPRDSRFFKHVHTWRELIADKQVGYGCHIIRYSFYFTALLYIMPPLYLLRLDVERMANYRRPGGPDRRLIIKSIIPMLLNV